MTRLSAVTALRISFIPQPVGLPSAGFPTHREIRDEAEAMRARIEIMLKSGVLDPQGKAIEGALRGLGFGGVGSVRQGKVIEIELAETDREKARSEVEKMCETLLANTVIENYSIELV
jgi:phosphoribosylformylglycinamidine synthase PurS subunit